MGRTDSIFFNEMITNIQRRLERAEFNDHKWLTSIFIMDKFIDSLGDALIFSILDYSSGYWWIEMASEDCKKTAFSSHHLLYCSPRMSSVLQNAFGTLKTDESSLTDRQMKVCSWISRWHRHLSNDPEERISYDELFFLYSLKQVRS